MYFNVLVGIRAKSMEGIIEITIKGPVLKYCDI